MGKKDYVELSREALNAILDGPGETYEPRGLFLVCDTDGDGAEIWTAFRNLDGAGETEEFRTRQSAVQWLHGGPARGVYAADVKRSSGAKEAERIRRALEGSERK